MEKGLMITGLIIKITSRAGQVMRILACENTRRRCCRNSSNVERCSSHVERGSGGFSGAGRRRKQREDRAAVAFLGLAYEHDLPEAERFYRSVRTGSMPLMTLVDEEF
jgi:hypothetical protein